MPEFTITISDKVIARLQALTAKHNQDTGESLTVKQWVIMRLKNMAMGDEFGQQIEAIRAASDQQFQDAVEAKRLELMATYG
jgi:hypothetical protein